LALWLSKPGFPNVACCIHLQAFQLQNAQTPVRVRAHNSVTLLCPAALDHDHDHAFETICTSAPSPSDLAAASSPPTFFAWSQFSLLLACVSLR